MPTSWLAPWEVLLCKFIGLCCLASAQGAGLWWGLCCQECIVALKPHWLCRAAADITFMFGTHLSWITYRWFRTASVASDLFYLIINIMRVFTWAYKKVVSFFVFIWRERTVSLHGTTSMPPSTTMNKSGMVTKINTRIRTDPFAGSYELVGKELGR